MAILTNDVGETSRNVDQLRDQLSRMYEEVTSLRENNERLQQMITGQTPSSPLIAAGPHVPSYSSSLEAGKALFTSSRLAIADSLTLASSTAATSVGMCSPATATGSLTRMGFLKSGLGGQMLRPDSSASGPVEGCIGAGGGSGDLGSPGTGKPPVRPFGGKEEE
ncbi:unnamed protein product, partial [Protopolystoma xenopodis]